MMINPDSTRLIRASALELRSNICAIEYVPALLRLVFGWTGVGYFACDACARGHIPGFRTWIRVRSPNSDDSTPKKQYNSRDLCSGCLKWRSAQNFCVEMAQLIR